MNLKAVVSFAAAATLGSAQAVVIVPTYDTFGMLTPAQLAAITFGGSGINSAGPVAVTSFASVSPGTGTVTLAMSATPRTSGAFVGQPVTNDGAGTYFVKTEQSPPAAGNNAGWNFNFAVLGDTRGLTFQFFADSNPGVGTNVPSTTLSTLLSGGLSAAAGSAQSSQDSQNLGFASPFPPFFPWDEAFSFDPNVQGEYTFSLRAFSGSTLEGEVAIRVSAVPEASTYAMLLAGLGMVGLQLRKRKEQTV